MSSSRPPADSIGERRPRSSERGPRLNLRNYRTIFAAPAACVALLAGMGLQSAARLTAASANAYHDRARAAIESIPTHVDGPNHADSWSARSEPVPREAVALLKPNVIRCWKFVDNDTTNPAWPDRWAILLVDQCRDARDMSGHYPPNCYVNSGEELTSTKAWDWTVGGLTITGTKYEFSQTTATASTRTAVYNFLIVPDRGLLRDMTGFNRVAENYPLRFYGAAQFQVVMNADLPDAERDDIFRTLMGPCVPVIRTLLHTQEQQTTQQQTPATTRPTEGSAQSSGENE